MRISEPGPRLFSEWAAWVPGLARGLARDDNGKNGRGQRNPQPLPRRYWQLKAYRNKPALPAGFPQGSRKRQTRSAKQNEKSRILRSGP